MNMVHLLNYVRGTNYLPIIISADKCGMFKWYIYGSHAIHHNMREHAGVGLTMG